MGTETFIHEQPGTDVAAAFAAAVDDACHEHGHEGYTGTLAEKDNYTLIQSEPMPVDQAVQLADHLIEVRDPRIAAPRGPAGAIPITGGERVHEVEIPEQPGGYPNHHVASAAAVADLLTDGEQIIHGISGNFETDDRGRVISGTATVPTRGATTHTGFLFFGLAPS